MTKIYIDDNGKVRDFTKVELAEDVVKLRNNKDYWEVIDKLVKIWAQTAPDDEKAMMINIDQYKETLIDKEFGQTKGGKQHERRFMLAFPMSLQLLIRTQYKAQELPFDRNFFRTFVKKYPHFKVAQKN